MRILLVNFALRANFGGILQCYALQEALTQMGHKVIKPDLPKTRLYTFSISTLIAMVKQIIKKYVLLRKNISVLDSFYRNLPDVYMFQNVIPFIDERINIIRVNQLEELNGDDYDAVIVGSDQVWRKAYSDKLLTHTTKCDNAFLAFAKDWNVKRLAYAGSFGLDYWEFSKDETKILKELILKFNGVSVREKSGIKLIHDNLSENITIHHVLDPTLLHNKDFYIKTIKREDMHLNRGSLLTYLLDLNTENEEIISSIESKYGVKRFAVNNPHYDDFSKNKKERIQPSISSWIHGFVEAKLVVADSFHACAFSIIFEKPFFVIANNSRGITRIDSLLQIFGLENRIINSIGDLKKIDINIDWRHVRELREHYKQESLRFICNSLYN